jgi:hypothetical protein
MIDVSCNCTSVNVRNEHIYHNNSHIQVYNAIKSSNKKLIDVWKNIYIHANYNNNNINDSISMHYVIALWCNDIQYINTFVIRECVSGNISRDHCDGYTGEHRKL